MKLIKVFIFFFSGLSTLKQKNCLYLIQSKQIFIKITFTLSILVSVSALGQSPKSFFPSHVGNMWVYDRNAPTTLEDWTILQDSLDSNGNRYLYARILRTGEEYWRLK